MIHAMLDLETLSTRHDAAIISIGLVKFDNNAVIDSQGWAFDLSKVTGHIDPSTVAWWMNQNEAAREFSFKGKEDPHQVAQAAKVFLTGCDEVWANDPDFDHVTLKSWWASLAPKPGPFPIHHRAARSFRTLMAEGRACGVDTSAAYSGKVAHNPIDDAAAQARAVILVRKALRAGREISI